MKYQLGAWVPVTTLGGMVEFEETLLIPYAEVSQVIYQGLHE